MKVLIWSVLVGFAIPAPAASTTYRIDPDGTGDLPSIHIAFTVAASGDTVLLASGTYDEFNLQIPGGVTLLSETQDPSTTAIDAGGQGRCLSSSSTNSVVRGVTLRNGTHAVEGGLGLLNSSSIHFYDCVFAYGSAPRGGAFSVIADRGANFTDCRFESNEATTGGAIYADTDANVGCNGCEFVENVARGHGGAIYYQKTFNDGQGADLRQSTFTGNHADGDGGALYSAGENFYFGSYLSGCDFTGNTATNGGACRLNLYDCVTRCSFVDNHATGRGGALDLVGFNTSLTEDCDRINRTLFARNSASYGGACALTSAHVFFYEDTFAGNEAGSGAHLWMSGNSTGSLWRTILAFGEGTAAAGGTGLATCSVLHENTGGDWVGPFAEEEGVSGNRSVDPLFCGMLVDDYTLREDSPCLPPQPADCGYTGGTVGAFGEGCGAVSVEPSSWGTIKARYR